MSKFYIALYDEHKLIGDFFHNSLERNHNYDVLFSTDSEENLFKYLNAEVKLLLIHAPESNERMIGIIKRIQRLFKSIKILIYSPEADAFLRDLNLRKENVSVVSVLYHSSHFFEALKELLPEHSNHQEAASAKQEYNLGGFEKIRQNRKWVLIIKCIEDGMKPKEMEKLTSLKWNTIYNYIEQMQKETGCRNQAQLLLQAKARGIV